MFDNYIRTAQLLACQEIYFLLSHQWLTATQEKWLFCLRIGRFSLVTVTDPWLTVSPLTDPLFGAERQTQNTCHRLMDGLVGSRGVVVKVTASIG